MKDNTYVAITLGLLLGVCLLVLIGAAPISHWITIPGTEWRWYDTSSNQLFTIRSSDKAATFAGVLDAGAGIRSHGTVDAASQTVKASYVFINGATNSNSRLQINGTSYDPASPTNTKCILRIYGTATTALDFGSAVSSPYCLWIQGTDAAGTGWYPLQLNPLGGKVIIGAATSPVTGYDLTVNNGIYSGGTIYGAGTISGQTIADRTPGSPDDALTEIRKMEVVGDSIKHETLGFARAILKRERVSTVLYDEKTGAQIDSFNRKLSDEEIKEIPDGIYVDEQKTVTQEDGRDLSKLASMLTRAVQQLDERIMALEGK